MQYSRLQSISPYSLNKHQQKRSGQTPSTCNLHLHKPKTTTSLQVESLTPWKVKTDVKTPLPQLAASQQDTARNAQSSIRIYLRSTTSSNLVTTPLSPKMPVLPSIIVHGGAWQIPDAHKSACRTGVETAASAGYKVLQLGGSALDAVEAAVRELESNPAFDAGRGSCLNAARGVEMDASIMTDDEKHGPQAGAVAALSCARHAVTIARATMEQTPHVLLVGNGADRFAREIGAELVEDVDELVTEEMREEWERFEQYGNVVETLFNGSGHDTVGAVARDENGVLACATSTGGITFKRVGRVGDSPIVGAGLFCERGVGACSTTGHGESILKVGLARLALLLMEVKGVGGEEAVRMALERMKKKTGGRGGVVLLDAEGEWVREFSTERMAWASIDKKGVLKSGVDVED